MTLDANEQVRIRSAGGGVMEERFAFHDTMEFAAIRLREQRRYEIARDVMAAISSRENGYECWGDQATDAVHIADALLAALEAK